MSPLWSSKSESREDKCTNIVFLVFWWLLKGNSLCLHRKICLLCNRTTSSTDIEVGDTFRCCFLSTFYFGLGSYFRPISLSIAALKSGCDGHCWINCFADGCALFCLACAGGTASPGCGGVLQLPALRLPHYLHHHPLSHRQRQGVLRVLLESEQQNLSFFSLDLRCKSRNPLSLPPCLPLVDEESARDSPGPQCHLHHVPHHGGEVPAFLESFLFTLFTLTCQSCSCLFR